MEVRRMHRTLLEESREVASTVEESTEQTTSDKESLNVANTSAQSANWSVSGTGGFSMGGLGASGSATQAGTISSSSATTIDDIHDTTLRSSRKVATQTKIQIKGVTETTVDSRESRQLRNPYSDRALSLNLFEINKRFEVRTSQDVLRAMLTVHLHPLEFTREFISANAPFLQDSLLDPDLKEALPQMVRALRQVDSQIAQAEQTKTALENGLQDLENYLFDDRPGWNPYHNAATNDDVIFDESTSPAKGAFADGSAGSASVDAEAVGGNALQVFFSLHAAHTMRERVGAILQLKKEQRRQVMDGLVATLNTLWEQGLDEGKKKDLLDKGQRTELFRRIPGFLFLYRGLIQGVEVPAVDSEMSSVIKALEDHLKCHRHYYTEQYVRYLWRKLGRTFVVRLANAILEFVYTGVTPNPDDIDSCRPYRNLYRVEDVQRDGMCVLIPLQPAATTLPGNTTFAQGIQTLAGELAKAQPAAPRTDQVIVPAEGVHMEPVAGACVLPPLPTPSMSDSTTDNCDGVINFHAELKCKDKKSGKDKADKEPGKKSANRGSR